MIQLTGMDIFEKAYVDYTEAKEKGTVGQLMELYELRARVEELEQENAVLKAGVAHLKEERDHYKHICRVRHDLLRGLQQNIESHFEDCRNCIA